MPCTQSCQCHVEGDRGLEGEGDGSAANPFTVEPEAARTIPRTAATAAALPVLSDDEIGQNAYVIDSGLNFVWAGVGAGTEIYEGWVPVAPRWSYATPANMTLAGTATSESTTGLRLVQGAWLVTARGILVMELPVGVSDLAVLMTVRSLDTLTTLGSESVQVSNADHAAITGFWQIPWMFATVAVVPLAAVPDFRIRAAQNDSAASTSVINITMSGLQLTGRNLSLL